MNNFIFDELKKIIKEADTVIRKNRRLKINKKEGNGNIVTSTDILVNECINSMLIEKFPNAQIISEEKNTIGKEDAKLKFIVDPIDGTSNFIKNWPCSVSIGVVNDNELVFGIILDIQKRYVYYAIKGKGAYMYNLSNPNKVTRLSCDENNVNEINQAIISYDFPYSQKALDDTQGIVKKLRIAGANLKTIGLISLEILKCGLGKKYRPNDYNDVCWHVEVRPWDVAAATCIVRELGCEVYSLKNNGNLINCEELTNKEAKIAFVATKSEEMATSMYNYYFHVIYDYDKLSLEANIKAKIAREMLKKDDED